MNKYTVVSLGYERPPSFPSIKSAVKYIRECIKDDKENAPYKVVSRKAGKYSWILNIGNRQGYNIYSTYTIINY